MWKKIKLFLTIVGLIGVAGASCYLYKTGSDVVKEASMRAQKEATVMNAIDRLEDYKKEKDFKYSILRKYELPDQTLWEIQITQWGAIETCSILENHPKIDFTVDSVDYNRTIETLTNANIPYETVRKLD